jgi:general secretion pathway protein A
MKPTYRNFFGLHKEPFGSDLPLEEILLTTELSEVKERFDYTLRIGALGVLTGEIGSGKSTALRYAAGSLHPAEYVSLYLTATTGSILELYRQILTELGIEKTSASKAILTGLIRQAVIELVEAKKMKDRRPAFNSGLIQRTRLVSFGIAFRLPDRRTRASASLAK